MKILIRIFLSIATLIVLFFLGLTILFIINKNTGKVTYIGPVTSFINTGSSMYPKIDIGNLVLVKKENEYNTGDIISFLNDENIITTHRIIEIKDGYYITKGDSNNFIDGYKVENKDIYGKMVLNIPSIRKIYKYLMAILIVLILLPFIVYLVRKLKNVR